MTNVVGTRRRVAGVDSLRAVAALAVVVCHINAYWPSLNLPGKLPQLAELGAHGVDLFIVISGFCLTLPLFKSGLTMRTGEFYGRRALRILPAYYVSLAVAAVLAMLPATYSLTVVQRATFGDLATHLTLAQTWFPDRIGTINGSLWSVSLEAQLYLVFPLVLVALRRWGFLPVFLAALVISIGWEALAYSHTLRAFAPVIGDNHVLPDRLVQFCGGALCAALLARRRIPSRPILIGVCLAFVAVGIVLNTVVVSIGSSTVWAIASMALVLLVTGRVGEALSRTPLHPLGRVSYSFYLMHQPILLLLAVPVALMGGSWWVQALIGGIVAIAACWGVAIVMYRLVEDPSHRWSRRVFPNVAGPIKDASVANPAAGPSAESSDSADDQRVSP